MVEYIAALLLLVIALLAVALRKTYNFFPVRELKRQARNGDNEAAMLYRAVAYGGSLRLFLWLVIGLSVGGSFLLLTRIAPVWLPAVALTLVIWYAFAWAPNGRLAGATASVAMLVTPAIAWILSYTHRPLDSVARWIARHRRISFHTGLFERDDLVDLINDQKTLADSRISQAELDIVLHALTFSENTAASAMVPGREVKTVRENDTLGPILMDELYESKYSRFPVVSQDGLTIVGILYLRDLISSRHGGSVRELMKPSVYYVHETQTLYQVLHAFLTTKHQLFVVVNNSAQYVGIITIEDVLEQVIGHKIEDEFDAYDDRHAVAEYGSRIRETGRVEAVSIIEPETLIEPTPASTTPPPDDIDETEIVILRD